jgi:glyoxylase I family protein
MVLGIDHIELIVRDVDEHVAFYEKLGFKVLLRTEHHGGSAELQLPGENQPVIEIHTATGEETIGINHIALKVANAQEAYDDVTSKGIKPDRGPHLVQVTGRTNVNLRDPDGWRMQLVDADRKLPQ